MKEQTSGNKGLLHKQIGSKYFELSGLILLIIIYSIFVQIKSGGIFLTGGNRRMWSCPPQTSR